MDIFEWDNALEMTKDGPTSSIIQLGITVPKRDGTLVYVSRAVKPARPEDVRAAREMTGHEMCFLGSGAH